MINQFITYNAHATTRIVHIHYTLPAAARVRKRRSNWHQRLHRHPATSTQSQLARRFVQSILSWSGAMPLAVLMTWGNCCLRSMNSRRRLAKQVKVCLFAYNGLFFCVKILVKSSPNPQHVVKIQWKKLSLIEQDKLANISININFTVTRVAVNIDKIWVRICVSRIKLALDTNFYKKNFVRGDWNSSELLFL